MFTTANSTALDCKVLYKNNIVENIYEACSCCYDNTKTISYLEKKKYIGKRVNSGHESILEHGRMALLFKELPKERANDLIELMGLEYAKWFDFFTVTLEDNSYNLIVSGTIRAYKCFINHITEDEYERNVIVRYIIKEMLNNTVKELYGQNQFMHFDTFIDAEPDVLDI